MGKTFSRQELALYPKIEAWLESYLVNKNPRAKVSTHDVHSHNLSDFLERQAFKKYFPEYATYKIKVDIVGVVTKESSRELTFVEVKDQPLNLHSLSQLIGYCKIVKPRDAFLISPFGLARPLDLLLNHFNRTDILEYLPSKSIRIAKWSDARNTILMDSIIPPF